MTKFNVKGVAKAFSVARRAQPDETLFVLVDQPEAITKVTGYCVMSLKDFKAVTVPAGTYSRPVEYSESEGYKDRSRAVAHILIASLELNRANHEAGLVAQADIVEEEEDGPVPQNENGLTLALWVATARLTVKGDTNYAPTEAEHKAWRAGEDPTEYAHTHRQRIATIPEASSVDTDNPVDGDEVTIGNRILARYYDERLADEEDRKGWLHGWALFDKNGDIPKTGFKDALETGIKSFADVEELAQIWLNEMGTKDTEEEHSSRELMPDVGELPGTPGATAQDVFNRARHLGATGES